MHTIFTGGKCLMVQIHVGNIEIDKKFENNVWETDRPDPSWTISVFPPYLPSPTAKKQIVFHKHAELFPTPP